MKQIHDEYEAELAIIWAIFKEKSVAYGKENIKDENTDTKEALEALYFRMKDKLNRFKTLTQTSECYAGDESLSDTLRDLANYALIASVVANGKWQ